MTDPDPQGDPDHSERIAVGKLRWANHDRQITGGKLRGANYGGQITGGKLRGANYGGQITGGDRVKGQEPIANQGPSTGSAINR
ncbi:hypothetical protein [Limnothrix redekei]|uniref:Uncharacterized protein n=1 Tax=Limnothrix redekei LRLZ20PSL1 TaxID=3112953 RepID=A0ABW7CBX5_9CYAN